MRLAAIADRTSDEHGVICQSYIDLPPRPSQRHRLHLMLPCEKVHQHPSIHPALQFGFVWRENLEAAKNAVAPGHLSQNLQPMFLFTKGSRSVAAHYVLNSNPNEVLGDLVAGRPTKEVTGSFDIHVVEFAGVRQWIGDVLPSDLHKALRRVALLERRHGPVKIALDPFIEAQYA